MNDTMITLQGWLGSDVTLRRAGDVPVASFRLACTPRRLNRRTKNWSDGVTQWYTVTAWRGLGENAADSLRRGDPVIVHGRLDLRTYVNADDVEVTTSEVEAAHLGHDLSRGTSQFTRTQRPDRASVERADGSATPEAATSAA
jgi:single-strand DNA-binding protein